MQIYLLQKYSYILNQLYLICSRFDLICYHESVNKEIFRKNLNISSTEKIQLYKKRFTTKCGLTHLTLAHLFFHNQVKEEVNNIHDIIDILSEYGIIGLGVHSDIESKFP